MLPVDKEAVTEGMKPYIYANYALIKGYLADENLTKDQVYTFVLRKSKFLYGLILYDYMKDKDIITEVGMIIKKLMREYKKNPPVVVIDPI